MALLIAAQEARDETRDLFSNPQEHPECMARLASATHRGQVSEFDELEASEIESEQLFFPLGDEDEVAAAAGACRASAKPKVKQMKMF